MTTSTFSNLVKKTKLPNAHKTYISRPFYDQANSPQNLHYFIYIHHNSGITYYLFIFLFYKGSCSDFKLKIYLKRVLNFIVFVWWGQFIMMNTQTNTKGTNSS